VTSARPDGHQRPGRLGVVPPELTLDRTEGWRRRMPLWLLRLAVAVPLLALLAVELSAPLEPCTAANPCRDALVLGDYWLGNLVVPWSFAGVPLALVAPRVAPWQAALVGAAAAAAPASDSVARPAWAVAATLWVVLGALDLLLRRRQDLLSRRWESVGVRLPVPAGAPGRLSRAQDARTGALVVGLLTSVATAGLLAWHAHALAGVRAFEARAVRADARVVAVSDDGYTLTLDVEGRRPRVPTLERYRTGDVLPVLVDPAGPGDVALVAEPRDPSWSLALAGLLVLAGATAALRLWVRGAARARLLARGGRAVRVRVGRREGQVVLGAVDDATLQRPLGAVSGVIVPFDDLLPFVAPDEDIAGGTEPARSVEADERNPRAREGRRDPRPRPWEPGFPTGLSDADLVAWADGDLDLDENLLDDEYDEEYEDDHPAPMELPLASSGGTVLTAVGLRRDGLPLALLDADGGAWVTGALRDPWRLVDVAAGVTGVVLRRTQVRGPVVDEQGISWRRGAPAPRTGPPHADPPPPAWSRVRDALAALAERYGLPLAYVLAALGYPVAPWLYGPEPSTWSVLHVLWLLLGPTEVVVVLAALAQVPLGPHRAGLLHRGLVRERVVPAARVRGVLAGREVVVLRLVGPDEALSLPTTAFVRYRRVTTPDVPTSEQARDLLLRWLADAVAPPPRWQVRPAATVGPVLVLVLGVLAAWAVPRVLG
jgi:hypothetical protein